MRKGARSGDESSDRGGLAGIRPAESTSTGSAASFDVGSAKRVSPAWGFSETAIENQLLALGAELSEGRGSRVRVYLEGVRAVFHRPHPQKETEKGAIKSVRRFLTEAGVQLKE